jgi:hypothetical protein
MKTLITASILSLGLFAGTANAADVSKSLFSDINATAPRSGIFPGLNDTAPRSLFDDINQTAPRSVFDDINQSAPRDDGVYGTIENTAP